MVLLKNLAFILFKLFVLLIIITFEKVVGLPVVFFTLLLVFFINEKEFYKYIYLIFGSIFLGSVYGISFAFSLLILVLLVLMVNYGSNQITSDINRVLFSIYSSIALVGMVSNISWARGIVTYLIIGSLVMIFILMKTLFARHGLTTEGVDKKGNFFR